MNEKADCSEIYYFNENGKKEGVHKKYNDNDYLIEECFYSDGKKDGMYAEYYDYKENVKRLECHYEKGILQGKYISRDENGKIIFEGQYENGKKSGAFIYYNGYSVKQYTEEYYDNKLDGKFVIYNGDGTKEFESNYCNGCMQGIHYKWNYKGQLTNILYYGRKVIIYIPNIYHAWKTLEKLIIKKKNKVYRRLLEKTKKCIYSLQGDNLIYILIMGYIDFRDRLKIFQGLENDN